MNPETPTPQPQEASAGAGASPSATLPGDYRVHQWTSALSEAEWRVRQVEDLSQLFCDIYSNTPCDDALNAKFHAAGDALVELFEALEEVADAVPHCRICGCTDERACEGGCSWVPDPLGLGDLCSACLAKVEAVL